VNLGAQTCNSDLKNNYDPVRVLVGGRPVDSGSIKVGCFVGDHCKTAIGTLINTGSVIGVGCNVHGGAVRKSLPSFSWGCSDRFSEHRLDKMLATAEAASARRRQEFTAPMREAIVAAFEDTRPERDADAGRAESQ
jgi:hypothetical protein